MEDHVIFTRWRKSPRYVVGFLKKSATEAQQTLILF